MARTLEFFFDYGSPYSYLADTQVETIVRIAPELGRDYAEELPRLAGLGVMRPHISHRFPMERAADAFRVLLDRKVVGKVVIEMAPSFSSPA